MKKPFNLRVDGEDISLTPESTGVGLFRNRPEMDYVDYHVPMDDEDGSEAHTWMFNSDFAHWVGGIALTPTDQRDLKHTERTNGTFREQTGWNAQTIIEDDPSEWELELYTRHLMGGALDDDEALHRDLENALREEFDE